MPRHLWEGAATSLAGDGGPSRSREGSGHSCASGVSSDSPSDRRPMGTHPAAVLIGLRDGLDGHLPLSAATQPKGSRARSERTWRRPEVAATIGRPQSSIFSVFMRIRPRCPRLGAASARYAGLADTTDRAGRWPARSVPFPDRIDHAATTTSACCVGQRVDFPAVKFGSPAWLRETGAMGGARDERCQARRMEGALSVRRP